MDPFDEFEFKPLTNGLGFHKKAAALKEQLKKSGVVDSQLQSIPTTVPKSITEDTPKTPQKTHTFEHVISSLEKTPLNIKKEPIHDLEISEILPREPKPVQSPFPRPEAFRQPFIPATPSVELKKTPTIQQQSSVGTRRGAADSPPVQLTAVSTSISSAILDLIVVVALSLVFVIALTVVTGVDVGVVMMNMGQDRLTQLSLGLLFVAVMQMYVVIARSFYGCTLGEWTFDMQLGRAADQASESYPLRVALRSLVVTLTGLFLLPFLSLVLGRDIAGQISGTQLYRQRM